MITGKANTKRIAVMKLIQVNRGRRIIVIPGALILITVTIKLNEAANEAIPRICKLIIQKSIPVPGF